MLRSSDDLVWGWIMKSPLLLILWWLIALQPFYNHCSFPKDPDLKMIESEDEFYSESVFDEEDNEMSDYDGSDEPDDLITLDQYQTGI